MGRLLDGELDRGLGLPPVVARQIDFVPEELVAPTAVPGDFGLAVRDHVLVVVLRWPYSVGRLQDVFGWTSGYMDGHEYQQEAVGDAVEEVHVCGERCCERDMVWL